MINRPRWYEHIERNEMDKSLMKQLVVRAEVVGCPGRSRPHKTWKESVMEDFRLRNIDPNMVNDQTKWKNALKTAIKNPTCGNRGSKWTK